MIGNFSTGFRHTSLNILWTTTSVPDCWRNNSAFFGKTEDQCLFDR